MVRSNDIVQVMKNNNSFSDYDDGIKMTSTMKWKTLVRQLGSDMNDEYHIKTRDDYKTKVVMSIVSVQFQTCIQTSRGYD